MAKVLLIEDESAVRLIVRVNLELHGFEVIEAADGAAGLALARAEAPDLVVLDLMLPEVDGWQVARELLDDRQTCAIPIVFLSAHADSSTRERALALGAREFITKPFDPLSLAARLAELLAED
jgi:DNA-binding response OmpR family regulator